MHIQLLAEGTGCQFCLKDCDQLRGTTCSGLLILQQPDDFQQDGVRGIVGLLFLDVIQIPSQILGVPLELEDLIRDISAGELEEGTAFCAALLTHDDGAVSTAHVAVTSADVVKEISTVRAFLGVEYQ